MRVTSWVNSKDLSIKMTVKTAEIQNEWYATEMVNWSESLTNALHLHTYDYNQNCKLKYCKLATHSESILSSKQSGKATQTNIIINSNSTY